MAWWLLATALEHIPQGNCITIGESERVSKEKVTDMKKIDGIYIKQKCYFSSQHYLVGFLNIQKIRQKKCPFLEKQSVCGQPCYNIKLINKITVKIAVYCSQFKTLWIICLPKKTFHVTL